MFDRAYERGIAPDRIYMEENAMDTEQNIRFSAGFCPIFPMTAEWL
jgi:uncharacterized SAM-binding protein YcdF (DUF218 family)